MSFSLHWSKESKLSLVTKSSGNVPKPADALEIKLGDYVWRLYTSIRIHLPRITCTSDFQGLHSEINQLCYLETSHTCSSCIQSAISVIDEMLEWHNYWTVTVKIHFTIRRVTNIISKSMSMARHWKYNFRLIGMFLFIHKNWIMWHFLLDSTSAWLDFSQA